MFLEKILDPTVAFSGFAVLIISTILKNINLIKFLSKTSMEETSFMSNSLKVFRKSLIYVFLILFLLLYAIFLFTLDFYNGVTLYEMMSNFNGTVFFSFLFASLMYLSVISIPYFQKKITEVTIKRNFNKRFKLLLSLTSLNMLTFLIAVSSFYAFNIIYYMESHALSLGYVITDKLNLFFIGELYDLPSIILLLIFTFICVSSLLLLPTVSRYLGYSESVIHLTLKNGVKLESKYMYNSNFRNGYIISDSKEDISKKMYIPSDSIQLIEFSTIYYTLGREQSTLPKKIKKNLENLSQNEKIVVNEIIQHSEI